MADDRTVPPSVHESAERIQSRPAGSDFARLPAEETHAREPGGGPHGTVSSGSPNYPLVLIAIGFLVLFTAFGLDSGWPVVAGILLILVGGIWGGVRSSDPQPAAVHSDDAGVAQGDPAADREPAARQSEEADDAEHAEHAEQAEQAEQADDAEHAEAPEDPTR